jgi:hypothetical protein
VIVPVDIYMWNLMDVPVPNLVLYAGAPAGISVSLSPPNCITQPPPDNLFPGIKLLFLPLFFVFIILLIRILQLFYCPSL